MAIAAAGGENQKEFQKLGVENYSAIWLCLIDNIVNKNYTLTEAMTTETTLSSISALYGSSSSSSSSSSIVAVV